MEAFSPITPSLRSALATSSLKSRAAWIANRWGCGIQRLSAESRYDFRAALLEIPESLAWRRKMLI